MPKIQTAMFCSTLINEQKANTHHLGIGMCSLSWLKDSVSSFQAETVTQEGTPRLVVVTILYFALLWSACFISLVLPNACTSSLSCWAVAVLGTWALRDLIAHSRRWTLVKYRKQLFSLYCNKALLYYIQPDVILFASFTIVSTFIHAQVL